MLTRRGVLKKTLMVGIATLVSRFFGLARELLMMKFLGVGAAADAFIAAFALPNSLRKLFAEGALNAAFLPTITAVFREQGVQGVNALVTLTLCVTQGVLFLLCLAGHFGASWVIWAIAPGFSAEQYLYAVLFLRVMIFFLLFVSTAALYSAALQVVHHFEIPAHSQIAVNIFFIIELIACIVFHFTPLHLAYFVLLNGIFLVVLHMVAYWYEGLSYQWPMKETWVHFKSVGHQFLPCIIGIGSVELSLYVDRMVSSYLPEGSVALIYYAQGLLRLPLSVFATAFATIFLPHVSHVAHYAPQRLSYYLFESTKFIFWVTVPTTLLMIVFSYNIFETVAEFVHFTPEQTVTAGHLLAGFGCGLLFFSLNKIVITLFYAQRDTLTPTLISLGTTALNTILNIIALFTWGIVGIVTATSVAAAVQTAFLYILLRKKYGIHLYETKFFTFIQWYILQLVISSGIFFVLYKLLHLGLSIVHASEFWFHGLGYWVWVGPLCGLWGLTLFLTRTLFNVKISFLEN